MHFSKLYKVLLFANLFCSCYEPIYWHHCSCPPPPDHHSLLKALPLVNLCTLITIFDICLHWLSLHIAPFCCHTKGIMYLMCPNVIHLHSSPCMIIATFNIIKILECDMPSILLILTKSIYMCSLDWTHLRV